MEVGKRHQPNAQKQQNRLSPRHLPDQTRVWPEEELEKKGVGVHESLSSEETEAQVSRREAEAHLLHLWGR